MATSTKEETEAGAHVTTVVTENVATASDPLPAAEGATPRVETPRGGDTPRGPADPPEGVAPEAWGEFCSLTRSGGRLDPGDETEAMGAGPPAYPKGFKSEVRAAHT